MRAKKALKNTVKVLIFFIAWAICVSIGEIDSDNPAIWRFWAEVIPLLWMLPLSTSQRNLLMGAQRP